MSAEVDRYYAFYVESDSGAETDAFTYNRGGGGGGGGGVNFSTFSHHFLCIPPPFSIIPLLLRKIECENAEGVRLKKLYISLT